MINMNDLLSVIIPVYNQENNLKRCLDSIVAQTYKNLEVILIDDGSTDDSFKICRDYADKYGWIAIHIANGGVSNARNIGLDKASGKYILFIDSDDYVSSNYIISLYNMVKTGACDIAYSKYAEVKDSAIKEIDEPTITKQIIDVTREFDYGKSYMLRHAACCIISRELIGDIRFRNDIYVGEDAFFISQLIVKSNHKVGYIKESTYYYVIYKTSGNHGKVNRRKMTVINAWNLIIENYKENNIESLVSGCYASLFREIESLVYRLIIDGPFDKQYFSCCVQALRSNYKGILRTTSRLKTKIRYIWLMLLPKSYVRLVMKRRK